MLSKRIIACLDVRDGHVVKGVNFEGLRSAGDPAELARRYNVEGIDELVILDITATIEARRALADTIRAVARELFIPLAVGGGIRSEDDAAAAVEAGADKVSLNTAALGDPALITTLADRYGSQAVVVAIDGEWTEAILERIGGGRPLLGICLGMQWLFEGSDEAPDLPGLGVLSGRCYRLGGVRLKPDTVDEAASDATVAGAPVKVPHVGWNDITFDRSASIVDGVSSGAQVYFTHSYVAPITGDTIAFTEHGGRFASVVQRAHIAGVQFHPEKSGDVGLRILRNFLELAG